MPDQYPIHYLRMRNIGIHDEFAIRPSDFAVVELTGGGETGKTTVLDAIVAALTGKNGVDPVQHGADAGEIETIISGVKISRTISPDGKTTELRVIDGDNGPVRRPQEWLTQVFGSVLLRPLELYAMKPTERVAAVFQACAVAPDLARTALAKAIWPSGEVPESEASIEREIARVHSSSDILPAVGNLYEKYYLLRREEKRVLSDLDDAIKARRAQVPGDFENWPEPQAPPPLTDVYSELDARRQRNMRRQQIAQTVATLEAQIAQLVAQRDAAAAEVQQLGQPEETATLEVQINQYQQATDAYTQRMGQYQATKTAFIELRRMQERASAVAGQVRLLEERVGALKVLPAKLLAMTAIPVPGLELRVSEDGKSMDIVVDGVPLEERGDSMKLDVCVRIAKALAPERFKVVLIDGAERMDPTQRENLVRAIVQDGYQAVMTRVTDGDLTVEYRPADTILPSEDETPPVVDMPDDPDRDAYDEQDAFALELTPDVPAASPSGGDAFDTL